MVSQSELDFHRRCVVVADDASPAAAFLIDTLRLDGHRVTHLSDARAVAFDLALDDCHLFICGSGIGGMRAVNLIANLRDNEPDLPFLSLYFFLVNQVFQMRKRLGHGKPDFVQRKLAA